MPGSLSKPQEKYWSEAKKVIKDETGKPQKKLKDKDWATIMKIYKNKANKHLGKGKWKTKKKKSELISKLLSFADYCDTQGLYSFANSVEDLAKTLLQNSNGRENE